MQLSTWSSCAEISKYSKTFLGTTEDLWDNFKISRRYSNFGLMVLIDCTSCRWTEYFVLLVFTETSLLCRWSCETSNVGLEIHFYTEDLVGCGKGWEPFLCVSIRWSVYLGCLLIYFVLLLVIVNQDTSTSATFPQPMHADKWIVSLEKWFLSQSKHKGIVMPPIHRMQRKRKHGIKQVFKLFLIVI